MVEMIEIPVPALQPRQLMHLEVGNDEWEPSKEELATLAELFSVAAKDPKGAIVATRDGVRLTVVNL